MNHSGIKASVASLAVAALVGLSACGGGSDGLSKADEEALQAEVEAAKEAQRQAELEQARAEAAAEEARRQRQAAEAERQREEQARQAAEEQRRQEEEARQAAEAEQQRLREEAQQAINRAQSSKALAGLRSTTALGAVAVTPRYSSVADVTATPTGGSAVNFASKSRSSSGGWSVTTLSNAGFTHNDQLVVYSNRGGATRVLLTQEYSTRFTDSDTATANTPISAAITDADGRLIKSGSFPTRDGDDKTFPNNYENDANSAGPDIVRIGGSFDGASGHFQCETQPCTIGKRGDRYTVGTSWTFHTTDAARVLVDDKSYAYFGWWRREQKSDESLSYLAFSGTDGNHLATTGGGSNFDLLGGTVTYRGPAIGQYAIYQPLGTQSTTGAFTADAVLTADFSANNLSGTVTNFSNDSSWSLALNQASMAGGDVDADSGTVGWTIAGNTSARQGAWDAVFFSEAPYVGQTPDGVVGEFSAIYDADADEGDDIGRIIGVFGARK